MTRPKVTVKKITREAVKSYEYVRPNPGVRAIASINGRGAYSARSGMSGLSAAQRKLKAATAVKNATRRAAARRLSPGVTRLSTKGKEMAHHRRRLRSNKSRRSAWAGTRQVTVRIPRSNAHESRYPVKSRGARSVHFRVPSDYPRPIELLASNRRKKRRVSRRKLRSNKARLSPRLSSYISRTRSHVASLKRNSRRRRRVSRRRKAGRLTSNKRRVVRRKSRRVVGRKLRSNRRRKASSRRRVSRKLRSNRRRRVSRRAAPRRKLRSNRRRKSAHKLRSNRRRKVTRRSSKRVSLRSNRRHSSRSRKSGLRRNGEAMMDWLKTGGYIAAGVIGHKLLTGLLKNILVSKAPTAAALPSTDSQADGTAPASGLGFLPAALVPYASTISGGVAAAAGVYAVNKLVKDRETRTLVAGGMVASFLHTLIVDVLKKQAPSFAAQVSGIGASDSYAARLSAMFGVGATPTSIGPMFAPIGEYFEGGMNGLGEYFEGGMNGLGEYFEGGMNGLGEYGSNPDVMQAAAGYGAIDAGSNSNHLDPSSNLDRELSIAEAAAGVGGMQQAAAGLGDVYQAAAGFGSVYQAAAGPGGISTVPRSQTWIPGQSNGQIWAGVRPVDRSQQETAMIPAGSLQSGGGAGIFG